MARLECDVGLDMYKCDEKIYPHKNKAHLNDMRTFWDGL